MTKTIKVVESKKIVRHILDNYQRLGEAASEYLHAVQPNNLGGYTSVYNVGGEAFFEDHKTLDGALYWLIGTADLEDLDEIDDNIKSGKLKVRYSKTRDSNGDTVYLVEC